MLAGTRLSSILLALVLTTAAQAMMPFPRPEPTDLVVSGIAGPFAGNWSIVSPTMDASEPDRNLAICKLPVRIEAIDDRQMMYYQPGETKTGTILDVSPVKGGTLWRSTVEDESFFTFWVSPDGFYLYDQIPQADPDWGRPLIYRRCP